MVFLGTVYTLFFLYALHDLPHKNVVLIRVNHFAVVNFSNLYNKGLSD